MFSMFSISSPAFENNQPIPRKYTAEGENISPPLEWLDEPIQTKSFVLIVDDWKRASYGGPAPPVGRHRYFHKLYALDTVLPDLERPTKARLLNAMRGRVAAEAQLIGTYQARR